MLAETDVINRVSRDIPTPDILKGIHLSMASRIVKLLKVTSIETGTALLTGGLALDTGLLAANREEMVYEKVNVSAISHRDSIYAGPIGAALWGGDPARRALRIAYFRHFRPMRRAGVRFGIVVASLGTGAPETFGAAGASPKARVPDTFHLSWRRAMTARPIRLALSTAAVVCAFPWIAQAEYRCAPPTNRIDRQACKAAAESPEALRHYVQRMRPIEILLFADYVNDATVRSWEAARARGRDAGKEANAAAMTTAARQ